MILLHAQMRAKQGSKNNTGVGITCNLKYFWVLEKYPVKVVFWHFFSHIVKLFVKIFKFNFNLENFIKKNKHLLTFANLSQAWQKKHMKMNI